MYQRRKKEDSKQREKNNKNESNLGKGKRYGLIERPRNESCLFKGINKIIKLARVKLAFLDILPLNFSLTFSAHF